MKTTYHVTHNYLGHHLGYVEAESRHDAIVAFSDATGMALAALVAVPHVANDAPRIKLEGRIGGWQ
jgi:hypothetical protein